jgi:hypothetical protein
MKLRILEKVEGIKTYLKDLKQLKITKVEDLNNKLKYYASSMITFSILNDFFVLGDEIIDELNLEIARTNFSQTNKNTSQTFTTRYKKTYQQQTK